MATLGNKHGHDEEATPVGWMDRNFGRLGTLSSGSALGRRHRSGTCWLGAGALVVLTTTAFPSWAIFYLPVFGLALSRGMMWSRRPLQFPFTFSENRFARIHRGLGIGLTGREIAVGFSSVL